MIGRTLPSTRTPAALLGVGILLLIASLALGAPVEAQQGSAPVDGSAPVPDTVDPAEAADRAWIEGDVQKAVRLYEVVLAEDPDHTTALHRLALARAWDGEYGSAVDLLDRLLQLAPEYLDARVDRARVLAWRGDVEEAVSQLDALLEASPGHAGALEARAQFHDWAGRREEALSTYDRILAIAPGRESALRGRAEILSRSEDLDAAGAAYDSLLAVDPDDREALLGRARILSFADRLDEAAEAYRDVLARDSSEARAWQGLGRAMSWSGDLVGGEAAYRQGRSVAPGDVEIPTGLARNLRWQGRDAAALTVLERAREMAPGHGEIQEQLRAVRTALGVRFQPELVVEEDSDGNRMLTTSASASAHPHPRARIRLDLYSRRLTQGALNREAVGFTGSLDLQIEPGWRFSGGACRSETNGSGDPVLDVWSIGITSPDRYGFGGSATWSRTPVDATARLADVGVTMEGLTATARWTPTSRWRVDSGLGRHTFRGTEANDRWNATAALNRQLGSHWSIGTRLRTFGFEKDLNDGYFDPDRYSILEATFRWRWEPRRWRIVLEGAPGVQKVGADGAAAGTARGNARLVYRLGAGREISAATGYSSTGHQNFASGASDYRYTAFILGARWTF